MNGADASNFVSFLQALRQDPVGKNLILTASASLFPWKDANGEQLKDVSGFAQTLDWVAIMNYDIWGSWCVLYPCIFIRLTSHNYVFPPQVFRRWS